MKSGGGSGTAAATVAATTGKDEVNVEGLSKFLTCKLCNGYFYKATMVVECVHTFCKDCLYKYLHENEVEACPECGQLINNKEIDTKYDPTIQSLVDSIFSQFFDEKPIKRKRGSYTSVITSNLVDLQHI